MWHLTSIYFVPEIVYETANKLSQTFISKIFILPVYLQYQGSYHLQSCWRQHYPSKSLKYKWDTFKKQLKSYQL